MKLKKLIESNEALEKLKTAKGIPAVTSYGIGKLCNAVKSELELFNAEEMKLINEYAEKNENGNVVIDANGRFNLLNDKANEFAKQRNELLEKEIELTFEPVNLSALEKADLEPEVYAKLDWLIVK